MALGIAIGTAIGVALDNVGAWLAIGLAFGAGIGSRLDRNKEAGDKESEDSEE